MPARLRHLRHRDLDGLTRERLDHLSDDLKSGLIQDGRVTFYVIASASNADNEITITGEDDIADGTPVVLVGDDLPDGLFAGVLYFTADGGADQYTLHASLEDAVAAANVVPFTDDGSGVMTAYVLN